MPPAGDNPIQILAHWREAGEWWCSEPPREITRHIDANGTYREKIRTLPLLDGTTLPEESLRIRRLKDEKVSIACGYGQTPDFTLVKKAKASPVAALHTLSGYAFGQATMIAAEIPVFAAERGYHAVLLADPFSLAGAFEFTRSANELGVQPLLGATFEMAEGGEIVLVAKNKIGYRNLSRLITKCHLGEPRLYPLCTWERLEPHTEGLLFLSGGDRGLLHRYALHGDWEQAEHLLDRVVSLFGREDVFIEIERSFLPWQIAVNRRLVAFVKEKHVVPVAGASIHYQYPEHFPAQDTLVCIDSLCLVEEVLGRKPRRAEGQSPVKLPPQRGLNAENYFRSVEEMCDLFADIPQLVTNTMRVAERCENNLLPGRAQLPYLGENEAAMLREVCLDGMRRLYKKPTRHLRERVDFELARITRLTYSGHFLIAWDMCNWARQNGILFSGRGSVVDSVVAYCLGLSRIDAYEHNLFFDRFLPDDGSKRPDIDIDFETQYRDDVRNYLTQKYGDAHVATVAAFGTYGTRGIVREVGKAMGIPADSLSYLAKRLHGSVHADRLDAEIDAKPELRNSNIPRERFRWVFRLAEQMMDLPRNARAHSSGVVISRDPIADTVPVMHSGIEDVKIIQWDKRSAKRCFDKFDVLCLRGNDVLGNTERRVREEDASFAVLNVPLDDPETYRTMRAGHLIGIPQSASPAMRQAHIRIKTNNLKDASIVQAGIRPGVGGAIKLNELIARRHGKAYGFNHPILEEILGPTYGIIVFQEQVDRLLQEFGHYSSDEAESIRELIYSKRREKFIETIREEVLSRIVANGFTLEVAQEVYEYVALFKGYGFAEGHALAFAEISIRSIWCQQNHPAPYFAALLSAQPAGYYGPCTIANEARTRGIKMLPPDVNVSDLTFTVEDVRSDEDPKLRMPGGGIRIPLRQISGISEELRERILAKRSDVPYGSFYDFVARTRPNRDELERLILCGALDALEPNRRRMLWAIPAAGEYAAMVASMENALPLLLREPEMPSGVQDFIPAERAVRERLILEMDVEQHLVGFERTRVRKRGGITAAEASVLPEGKKVFVVGNPIRLRFPPTSSGRRVMFFDLEDETGLLNVTCFDNVYQRDGHTVICSPYITLWGIAQHRDNHVGFLAYRIFPYTPTLEEQLYQSESTPIRIGDFLMK